MLRVMLLGIRDQLARQSFEGLVASDRGGVEGMIETFS